MVNVDLLDQVVLPVACLQQLRQFHCQGKCDIFYMPLSALAHWQADEMVQLGEISHR